MKGPYERLKYDLRRVWECPVCHHRERTPGSCTARSCACQQGVPERERRSMRLVEDGTRRAVWASPGLPAADTTSPLTAAVQPATAEQPKVEQPKVEQAKVEQATAEQAKVEQAKVEQAAPAPHIADSTASDGAASNDS